MIAIHKPLFALTAADLMSQSIVMVPAHMTLPAAARLLSQSHITGAPVVDEAGRCIGVLSATDFLHWVETGKGHCPPPCDAASTYSRAWQFLDPDTLPDYEVRAHMTPDPVLVPPATPIGELAQDARRPHPPRHCRPPRQPPARRRLQHGPAGGPGPCRRGASAARVNPRSRGRLPHDVVRLLSSPDPRPLTDKGGPP